jgi:hypothetical protein
MSASELPEDFLDQIRKIENDSKNILGSNTELTEDNITELTTWYNSLNTIGGKIQKKINNIVNDKPVKSEQLFTYYKDIYDATYMTNFCLFLGICLILWYILKSNTNSNVEANVKTS